MQHPDEPKIHEWLDGALTADEASAVESHVEQCVECQPRVAEARGLIAAASRILNSLDTVPNVAVPARTARRRIDGRVFQIAAMLTLVAGGGALVARARTGETGAATTMSTATVPPKHTIEERAAGSVQAVPVPEAVRPAPAARLPVRPNNGANRVAGSDSRATTVNDNASAPVLLSEAADASLAVAPPAAVANAAAAPSLTVVRTEQSAEGSRTYYELSPNRVAILVENATPEKSDFVGTVAAQAARVRVRGGIAKGVVGGTSTSALSLAPVAQDTIKWTDASGKTFVLFGPFSRTELADLKVRIQALRTGR